MDTAAHRQLAFEAALQGIVLLQASANEDGLARFLSALRIATHSRASYPQNNATPGSTNGVGAPLLPLQRTQLAGKKVAIVGPNAAATQTLLSNYHGTNSVVNNHSILAAFQVRRLRVPVAPPCRTNHLLLFLSRLLVPRPDSPCLMRLGASTVPRQIPPLTSPLRAKPQWGFQTQSMRPRVQQ